MRRKKINSEVPDFRDFEKSLIRNERFGYWYEKDPEEFIDGYNWVIVWMDKQKKFPIRLLEYLYKYGVLTTWPPDFTDQAKLVGIEAVWGKKRLMEMQMPDFSKKDREDMINNFKRNRLEKWIGSRLRNWRGKRIFRREILREIKSMILPDKNILPSIEVLGLMDLQKKEELLKKQKKIDKDILRTIDREKARFYEVRRKERKENPGLKYGERRKDSDTDDEPK